MQTINIATINFPALQVETDYSERGKFARMVHYDAATQQYIKTWKEDFYYAATFINALQAGFYTGLALITAKIITTYGELENICGYATQAGTPVNYANLDNTKMNDLADRLALACRTYNMVYIDFHINNVVEVDGRYYIVDLEPVIPVGAFGAIPSLGRQLQYNNFYYRSLIKHLIGEYELYPLMVRQHTSNEKPINYNESAEGRIYLEKEYLPSLAGSVLFIGVNYYNDFYCNLVQDPHLFHTLEVNPGNINDGSPHGHYICNLLNFTLPPDEPLYDHVCFFGILGHNDDWDILQTTEEHHRCLAHLGTLVKPGGTLLVGPATQNRTFEYWQQLCAEHYKNYEVLTTKRIHINYIWHGRRLN